MKILGGVILGFSVFLFLVSWLVTSELGKARLIFNWLMVLFLGGIGLFGYGIHSDRKAGRKTNLVQTPAAAPQQTASRSRSRITSSHNGR